MTTPMSAVSNFMLNVAKIINEETLRGLAILGEECVSRVKKRSEDESWLDHTENLRTSIGYSIYEYGKEYIRSLFKGNGPEGAKYGNQYIDELASMYAKTYALVVVAGMNYAELVEARDNKDVLASTELWAKKMLKSRIDGAMSRALKRINTLKV